MEGFEFIRVVTKDDEECFLLTKLKSGGKEGFELSLCTNGKVWTGEVSEDDLDTLSRRLKMDFDKYVKQTVDALTSLEDDRDTFQYQLKRQKDAVNFIWKKHVPAEDITFQLGSASLKERDDSTQFITLMFNHCITAMRDLQERIHSLETDNERLSQERISALKRLEKCVVAKEELEQDLYSKFTMVLNSKKEKIRQLKSEIGDPNYDNSRMPEEASVEASVESTNPTKRSRSPVETPAQKERFSDVDTDDEQPSTKRHKGTKPKSTQQKVKSTLADESLDFGNDAEDDVPQSSRPRRQRGRQQKKQTPSKPSLPRIGSNESQGKTPLRKRGSSSSNRSSENIDADDLLGQL